MTNESPFLIPSSTNSFGSLDFIDLPLTSYKYSEMIHKLITIRLIILVRQQLL